MYKQSYEEILPMPSSDNEEIYEYCFSLNESSKMYTVKKKIGNNEKYN